MIEQTKPMSEPIDCPSCQGTGYVEYQACCGAVGVHGQCCGIPDYIQEYCSQCQGTGQVEKPPTV